MTDKRSWSAGLLGLAISGALLVGATVTVPGHAQPMEPSVKIVDNPTFGPILTDKEGWTLYTWIPDEPPVSKCYGGCATAWPPALVEGDPVAPEGLPGMLGTTTREDGAKQLTYNDWPLYRFQRDTEPGQTNGDGSLGSGGLWPVVPTGTVTPTVMYSNHPRLGYILTDGAGMTLYTWEADQPKVSTCYEACATAWPPVLVEDKLIVGAGLSRVLGTTMRNDGTTQVTYKEMPLYRFRRDAAPGDANGEGSTGFGALWPIATFQVLPTPPTP